MTEEALSRPEYPRSSYDTRWGEPELKHYIGILRRRIWVVITTFVIIVTLATVYTFKATPIYQAAAKILIEKQAPRLMNVEDVMQSQASDRDYYRTQKELVRSRTVLERALEQRQVAELPEVTGQGSSRPSLLGGILGELRRTISAVLGGEPAAPPEPWERLRSHLKVEQVRDTHLLLVKAESEDPVQAATLATAVAQAFEQYHLDRKLATSGEALKVLRLETTKQEEKLGDAEKALQKFREQAQVVSLDVADKTNPVLVRLGRLNDQLTEAQLQRIELEAQFEVVKQALSSDDQALRPGNEHLFALPAVRADQTITELRTSLTETEKEVATLSDTDGPEHPQLQAVQAQVGLLQGKLQEALTQLVGSLTAQLEMLSNQEQELRRQYEEQNLLALKLAKQSLSFNRLQSEVERQRRLFDVLVERMREVDLTDEFTKTNVEVVEVAEPPRIPIRPKKARTVALSMFVGLFLGIGLAFFYEYLDDTVKTPEDLEVRVGLPVLGFVPVMDTKSAEMDGFSHRGSITMVEPSSSVSEAYRNIRTSLFFSAPAEETKVLVVTSSGPGDGKTTTATNLALIIAQSGKRVLLIDADFRRPMAHRVFGLESKVGLSTVLVGKVALAEAVQRAQHDAFYLYCEDYEDLVLKDRAGLAKAKRKIELVLTAMENLDILAAGPKPPNPAELLDSPGMHRLLEKARQDYDQVIIDTPPVLIVADASIVSTIADGVVMVVKSTANTRGQASQAREQLEGVRARILGGILNDVHESRLGYYYSNYHYYGYSRYHNDYYSSEEDEG